MNNTGTGTNKIKMVWKYKTWAEKTTLFRLRSLGAGTEIMVPVAPNNFDSSGSATL